VAALLSFNLLFVEKNVISHYFDPISDLAFGGGHLFFLSKIVFFSSEKFKHIWTFSGFWWKNFANITYLQK
ncbi:hypothetical protein ACJX0J_019342, partial [Zea mays]